MQISPVKIWRNQKKIARLVGKSGRIVSWTVIRVPPSGFENQAPYPVAVVRLTGGKCITAQVVDCSDDDLKVGLLVKIVVRKIMSFQNEEPIPYGIKVIPVIR